MQCGSWTLQGIFISLRRRGTPAEVTLFLKDFHHCRSEHSSVRACWFSQYPSKCQLFLQIASFEMSSAPLIVFFFSLREDVSTEALGGESGKHFLVIVFQVWLNWFLSGVYGSRTWKKQDHLSKLLIYFYFQQWNKTGGSLFPELIENTVLADDFL